MLFSLNTHRELFGSAEHGEAARPPGLWAGLATLAGVTVLVALVDEHLRRAVQKAAEGVRHDPRLRGFIVVAWWAAPARWPRRFPGARRSLD